MTNKHQVLILLRARGPMTRGAVEALITGGGNAILDSRRDSPGTAFRIAAYEPRAGHKPAPMYEADGGADEPVPPGRRTGGRPPVNRAPIVKLLREQGPMTALDIRRSLDWTEQRVHDTLRDARRLQPGQVFRITGYAQSVNGKKGAALYAAEAGEDAVYVRTAKRKPPKSTVLTSGFWAGLGGRGASC